MTTITANFMRIHVPPPLLFALVLTLTACSGKKQTDSVQSVSIAGRTFHLELAHDEATRVQGLSDRHEIDADGGMLFVFPQPQRLAFVMRRCHIPIDLICLDTNGYVVAMHEMQVEPDPLALENKLRRYGCGSPAQFAIELRRGTLDELGLKVADRIELPWERLAKEAQ